MEDFVYNAVTDLITYMLCGGDVRKVQQILTDATKGISGTLTTQGALGSTLYGVFKGVGISLIILYFLVDLYEHLSKQEVTADLIIKSLIKFALGYLLITNMLEVFSALVNLGDILTKNFVKSATAGTDVYNTGIAYMQQYVREASDSEISLLGMTLRVLVPYGIMWVTRAIIYGIAFIRAIELLARTVVAPVALSNVFGEDSRSAGWVYIKKYIAITLQGLCIVAIMWAASFVLTEECAASGTPLNELSNELKDTNIATEKYANELSSASDYFFYYFDMSRGILNPLKNAFENLTGWITNSTPENVQQFIVEKTGSVIFDDMMSKDVILMMCVVQCASAGVAIRSQKIVNDLLGV